jgi:hypothetical protein
MASLAEARTHNVPPEVFLKHYRAIRTLKDEQADAAAAVARAKKAAKNDGIDLKALKLLENLAKLDNDEAEMLLRHTEQYAKWIMLPIGMQGDFFGKPEPATVDAQTAQEQREWQAGQNGTTAGKGGHEREDNPYDVGSAEHVAWDAAWTNGHAAWMKGQEKIAGELAANANGSKRTRRASADAH